MNFRNLIRGVATALATLFVVGCANVSPYLAMRPAIPSEKPNILLQVPTLEQQRSPLLPPSAPTFAGSALLGTLQSRVSDVLGVRYVLGGTSLKRGFDCSGLVRFLLNDLAGNTLPRTSKAMSRMPAPTVDRDALEPGDVLFFNVYGRGVSHVGVYVGDGEFVHAAYSSKKVRVAKLSNPYWRKRYAGAKRVVSDYGRGAS